jgi:hypothetical protein
LSKHATGLRLSIGLACAAVLALYVYHAFQASLSIDGLPWFWLDDDQMISMRYARNLVEGHGLVWNPGEYVEGYTNFGWTMVMAAAHLLPLPDRLMALPMLALSAVICLTAVVLSARLLGAIEQRHLVLTVPITLLCIVTCTDVMFWATEGFETILVTALHLAVVLRAIRGGPLDAKLFVPLALIPLVRSDGMHVWLGDAILIFWLASDRRRAAALLVCSLAPFAMHLMFRLAYYGEFLPNTYYLKVSGLDDRWSRGLDYVIGFCRRYSIVLILAVGTAASLWRIDIRTRSLLTTLVPPLIYSITVGGDSFGPFRFFAHVMPELFIWAAVGAAALVTAPFARVAWLAALAVFVLPAFPQPIARIASAGNNGDPFDQVVVAAQLRKNASPDASVAVIAAGIVPYFTRLRAIDLLGKNDAHIAHLPPRPGATVGHGKLDPDFSFDKLPDYVVTNRSREFARDIGPGSPLPSADYVKAILASPPFRESFEPNPLPDPFLLQRTAMYVRDGSPEMAKIETWKGVSLR